MPAPTAERLSLLFDLGRWADLKRAALTACGADPADPTPREFLASALFNLGDPAGAVEVADAALALHPQSVSAHLQRGWALESLGDLPGAHAAAVEALRLDPDCSDALRLLAMVCVATGQPGRAREACRRSLELRPDDLPALVWLAQADLAENRFRDAAESLRRAHELNPDDAGVHLNLGRYYQRLAESGAGAAAYRLMARHAARGTALNPTWPGHREQWQEAVWGAHAARRWCLAAALVLLSFACLRAVVRPGPATAFDQLAGVSSAGAIYAAAALVRWENRELFFSLALPRAAELRAPLDPAERFYGVLAWALGLSVLGGVHLGRLAGY